jgi:hypothetical protein
VLVGASMTVSVGRPRILFLCLIALA